MNTNSRKPTTSLMPWVAALIAVGVLGSSPAAAQTVSYTADLPIVRTVPNPCTTGFVVVNGTVRAGIATVKGTDFKLQAVFSSSGSGMDATADGVLLATGQAPYAFTGQLASSAEFPDGVPSFFEVTLTLKDYLLRQGSDGSGPSDSFILATELKVAFTNGVPSAPTLSSLSVSCR